MAVAIALGVLFLVSLRPLFGPGPIRSVSPGAWARLRVGMTKDEVVFLLGDAEVKSGPGKTEVAGRPALMTPELWPEFWEYNWTDGFPIFSPSDKAFVVYFDSQGRVSSFREPKRGSTR
ncbi:MAG: hypothetical protein HY682_06315 [Chloroflexi bacterium]|nr:hypothetical protein [Chloroflexota bacterium]